LGWRLSTSLKAAPHLGQQGDSPVSFRWQSESEEFEWEAAVVSNCLA